MNQEERYAVVLRAQAGNADAIEQLLLWTYTPLTWLCRTLFFYLLLIASMNFMKPFLPISVFL